MFVYLQTNPLNKKKQIGQTKKKKQRHLRKQQIKRCLFITIHEKINK